MDNEALVRALRKFEQQNESLKKVFFLQSMALWKRCCGRNFLVSDLSRTESMIV